MKLQADNINGVYKVSEFEGDVLSQEHFYESLRSNAADSIICAEVDAEMAEKIQEEYGIH
jgi:hypothetical protein